MKIIAQLLAVYIFLGSLMPGMDFVQLAKVGTMLAHYNTHLAEAKLANESTSFFDYVKVHLIAPDGHEHSDFDHHQLPYQSLTNTMLVVKLHDTIQFSSSDIEPYSERNFHYTTSSSLELKSTIFHPPIA